MESTITGVDLEQLFFIGNAIPMFAALFLVVKKSYLKFAAEDHTHISFIQIGLLLIPMLNVFFFILIYVFVPLLPKKKEPSFEINMKSEKNTSVKTVIMDEVIEEKEDIIVIKYVPRG